MNQKTLWIILAVVVVAILGFWLYSRNANKPAETEDDVATTTEEEALFPEATPVMEDGAGGPPVETRGEYTDGSYALQTEQSSIAWTGYKTLIKNYEDHGTLAFTSGSVVVANGNITSGEFVVDMSSLTVSSTSNTKATGEMLEGHLKSPDFFEIDTYPTASIKVRNVINGIVTADVTIKGTTKIISFPATITQDGDTLSATAKLSIDRALWDIRYGSESFFDNLGNNVIGDKVDLELTLVATKA